MSTNVATPMEPIPGYLLRERLGSGGYGEVWKAEAPGGLSKAVKLVYGELDEERAANELKALLRIRDLRHPFLLSLERIEVTNGRLVIVTELADGSLKERFDRCVTSGLPGIPRRELLQYMRDAADALDYMNEQHSLQHLDVKPENLLIVGEHIKVADFGLVKDMHQGNSMSMLAGMTPIYAATELFDAAPSRRSDQYSLAIVYQCMLTGILPYPGKTAAQLANMHINARPMLGALPPGDRKVIGRALAKDPQQRFASCRDMVQHLCDEALQKSLPDPDSWFTRPAAEQASAADSGSPGESVERTSVIASPDGKSGRPSSAPAPSSTFQLRTREAVRSAADMFETLDEADGNCQTEFVATIEMQRRERPEFRHESAPELTGKFHYRPTLFIGVGRAAGMVMQQIKRRLHAATGTPYTPLAEFLLLDSDSKDLQRALRGDDGEALQPGEALHMGLRKSQEYRGESPVLSQWLSRRWLFNIPRSQKPEGLRPLGRLAFVDHARTIHVRLKKALQRITSADARQQAASQLGHEVETSPRVVLVGATGGGTASGAMLDLGFLARQKMEKLGFENGHVTAILFHYLNRTPATHDLALVNSFSVLTELSNYAGGELDYPGDASCGIEPRPAGSTPFHKTYFVTAEDYLSDDMLSQHMQRVADYLYAGTFTSGCEFFERLEPAAAPEKEAVPVLGTFGVERIGLQSSPVLLRSSATLCNDLVELWLGEKETARQVATGQFNPLIEAFLAERKWNAPECLNQLSSEFGQIVPRALESFLEELMPAGVRPDSAHLGDINIALTRVASVLGPCSENGLEPVEKLPAAAAQLVVSMEQRSESDSKIATAFIYQPMELPGARTWSAQFLSQGVLAKLGSLQEEALKERSQLRTTLLQLEERMGAGTTLAIQKKLPVRANVKDFLALFASYVQTRIRHFLYCVIENFARRVKVQLSRVTERLQDVRRDLKHIARDLLASAGPHRKHGPDADRALGECIQKRFEQERTILLTALDEWLHERVFASRQGFLATITRGGDDRIKLQNDIHLGAHMLLEESLRSIDLIEFLLTTDPASRKARIEKTLSMLHPGVLTCAAGSMLITLNQSPSSTEGAAQLASAIEDLTQARPAVVAVKDTDITFIVEADGQPLTEVALRLIDYRNDLIEYASRVYSRSDIPFRAIFTRNT